MRGEDDANAPYGARRHRRRRNRADDCQFNVPGRTKKNGARRAQIHPIHTENGVRSWRIDDEIA